MTQTNLHATLATIDSILQAYKAYDIPFGTAFQALVYDHCLSAGNATEMLSDMRCA